MSTDILSAIGLTIIFVGLVLVIVGIVSGIIKSSKKERNENQREETKTEYGGVIFIGPIPIVFGSNKDMAKMALIIGVIMVVLIIAFVVLSYVV
ncbi:TIGR00304 family membrane protein [Sulfolobus acidocaldarius]|uniref:Conserved Archaeal membrane protein n=4 Tax=Sulfolobus acidocaldarius TaxID=2285 RepID=Q4JCA2_SULAC|nr:DUF131 domain-containing protein [Sulfolobus acidocaldarius]AAY79577.1 conserved Archaeal membrane protein [Sulfolobus acidocaldarius DSM 639]AGE70130.1 hypothetical protein SacN8_00745 [Sulfolobus acidocaldarius N8]AGE72405.1 hypothetical protein SacRon12I_00745 [Sulfolobus acidocaldarius Ron12/I]ALU29456.1 hypothetical protein ATY89_05505 [Sulfolobus acidocaldarius]ALU32185.1 hypothetical protein ATZ20_08525 [Sulfolobus acidocaldarius]